MEEEEGEPESASSLRRSTVPVPIQAGPVNLGQGVVHVGELPGMNYLLSLMEGGGQVLDPSQVPGVILGLDFLRQTYRMVLRVQANEVWFEELDHGNSSIE